MVGLAIRKNRVNDHTVPRDLVKNRVGMPRQFQAVKRLSENRSQPRKFAKQVENVIKIVGKDFTTTSTPSFIKRVDRKRIILRREQQDYFRHTPSAIFRFTSSQATTRLGSRR